MALEPLHTHHERSFETNRFVYPVLSRRSGGISIGVNLNPDKVCNFDCVYCQVDRTSASETRFVELDQLFDELDHMLAFVGSGQLFETPKFAATPESLRRLNDIAFSGDGEPTTYRNFDEIIASAAELKRRHGLGDVKMVLITNASMFHRPHVQRGLTTLMENNGEIWAKLDAGTDEYFRRIDRTSIPFSRVLENIRDAARRWPLVIQSLFMRVAAESPTAAELDAYCDRLNEVTAAGGELKLIQIYTIARRPAESFVTPLRDGEVDALAELVERRTGLKVARYYGAAN
ncbi:MAG: radical SAM protein [Planctomycetales bacterium]|nr:radical SAM protein [Planctomycetales bacterium]